ncbi:MAG TPA: hypothetical protein VN495_03535 [Candidatus Paceibacterota bacterium]|nr:hypothetical protein [Candidatus Paceibacterota bacterium]
MRFVTGALCALCVLAFVGWGASRIYQNIVFDRNVSGYLKQAADANTVPLARDRLEIAIKEADRQGLTTGFTSLWYTTPDEDIGFWHTNLSAALSQLKALPDNVSQLEESNVLKKLRETLLDHGKDGEHVTVPPGISIYPYNTFYQWWWILSLLLAMVFLIVTAFLADRSR